MSRTPATILITVLSLAPWDGASAATIPKHAGLPDAAPRQVQQALVYAEQFQALLPAARTPQQEPRPIPDHYVRTIPLEPAGTETYSTWYRYTWRAARYPQRCVRVNRTVRSAVAFRTCRRTRPDWRNRWWRR